MKRRNMRSIVAAAGAVVALTLAAAGPASAHNGDDHTTPPAPGAYGSKAQVVEANLHDIPVGPLTVANWPAGPTHAVLTGSQHFLDFGILEANANGSYEHGWNSADASIAHIGGGLPGIFEVELGAITSQCRSDATGLHGSSSIASGSIKIVGYPALKLPINPPPNTHIGIPGLIDIYLNKQEVQADGSLTVTALDIHGTKLLQGLLLSQHPLYLTVSTSNCDKIVPPLEVPAAAGVGKIAAGATLAVVGAGSILLIRRRRTADEVA